MREKVLDLLIKQRVVRIEPRLDGLFVEITHEFLIQPVLDAIRARHTVKDFQYREAIRILTRYAGTTFSPVSGNLPTKDEFEAIHANRDRIVWAPEAIELMVRTAIARGVERSALEVWLKEAALHSVLFEHALRKLDQFPENNDQKSIMSRGEWLALEAGFNPDPPGDLQ